MLSRLLLSHQQIVTPDQRRPAVHDNEKARACARSIAGWTPLRAEPRPVTRLRPRKDS
jgi:hypothetical protein